MRDGRNFQALLTALGAEGGLDLSPDPHGVVSILLDDVTVSLESPAGSAFLYLHAGVRRLGADRAGEIETALAQNLFRLPLSGAWLALDATSDELLLCAATPLAPLTPPSLRAWLAAMVTGVRDLRDHDRDDAARRPSIAAAPEPEWLIRA